MTQQMTAQEVLDKAAAHLLTQGEKASRGVAANGDPACAYRGVNGTKCAVGCLIPDSLYTPDLEGYGWHSLVSGEAQLTPVAAHAVQELVALLGTANNGLIDALQLLHDNCDVSLWPYELRVIACARSLSPAIVDTFDTGEKPWQPKS